MKKTILTFLVLAITGLIFNSCAVDNKKHFVKVNGLTFEQNGQPYYYIGTNFWYGAYLGADAEYGDRDRLLAELDQLKALGVNNLRVAAASEESDFALPLSPPFQYKDGSYNETLFVGLDFLLHEMSKRNIKAVLFLNNYWDWTGGMSQYVSWEENVDVVDPTANPAVEWKDYIAFSSRFYANENAQIRYRKYIETLLNRKNTISGIAYKNDPTIMAWQLANEPRPNPVGEIEQSIADFSSWVDQTAAYIKSLDNNHMVSIGSEGSKGSLNELKYAEQIHQSSNIDYVTFHLWPKNWGWYKAAQPDSIQATLTNAKNYIDEHVAMSERLNKPAVVEEFGLERDGINYKPYTTTTNRDTFYQLVFDQVLAGKNNGTALVGCNFWAWSGKGRAIHDDAKWRVGDVMYVGDPYSEHQGLNSVFDTDSTTHVVIKKYSDLLK